jgi:hypothetical protein
MGAPAWALTGNSGTNPSVNSMGTTDNEPLVIKTNGQERVRIDTAGNVGIGTANPNYPLHLPTGKALRVEGGKNAADSTDYFSFGGNGTFGIDAPGVVNGRFVVQNSGNVGVGTPSPASRLHVSGDMTVSGGLNVSGTYTWADRGAGQVTGSAAICTDLQNAVLELSVSAPGALGPVLSLINTGGGTNAAAAIDFYTFDPGEGSGPDHETSPTSEIKALDDGNFGNHIVFLSNKPGVANNGLKELMRITSAGNVTVPGDILLTGADCAEQFDASDPDALQPGTVVVIDEGGALRESSHAYDKKVAGVISGAGDYSSGILLDNRSGSERRVPVALAGKTYCKVDAEYSPIEVGDLLTTSLTPGHAMKATQFDKAFGAIIGKALKPLPSGSGLIPILVALQ